MSPEVTPSQTVGPYFLIGLDWGDEGKYVVKKGAKGLTRIHGFVIDGNGDPIPDALIETWQADADGRFDHPDDPRGAVKSEGFGGFGRSPTDDDGEYEIFTVKPGTFPDAEGTIEAPHLIVHVFARGMLAGITTRIYFDDETEANAADPVLARVPADRRDTLIAKKTEDGYRLDIHLQGPQETVFFDV
jgi:protocatechuate 3,4-dioxygenase alpha subunit